MVAVSYLVHYDTLFQNATAILLQDSTVTTTCVAYYKIRRYSVYTIAHNQIADFVKMTMNKLNK